MPPGPPPGVPPRITRPLLPKPLGVVSAKPQINKVKTFLSKREHVRFTTVPFRASIFKSEEKLMFLTMKSDYFQILLFLYQRDLRISAT